MTYFGEFYYLLTSSWIRKSITLTFMSSSRNKFMLLYHWKLGNRCFVGFCWPCFILCSSRWAPAWHLHTNLYKFGWNISSDYLVYGIFSWPESWLRNVVYLPHFISQIPDFIYWMVLILIYFECCDTENQR